MTTNKPVCTSCEQPKFAVRKRASKLLSGTTLFLCNACWDGKFEPRWAVVLRARSSMAQGQELTGEVKDVIVKRRYVGKDIILDELM